MGYKTDYVLSVSGLKPYTFDEVDAAIHAVNSYLVSEDMSEDANWTDYDDTWYSNEEDIASVSAQFPELIFTLWGAGENHEDLWVKYFKAGLVQRAEAEIRYPDFDAALLEMPE